MRLVCKNNILAKDVHGKCASITIGKTYYIYDSYNVEDIYYYYDDNDKISLLYGDGCFIEDIHINRISDYFYSIEEHRVLKLNTVIDEQ